MLTPISRTDPASALRPPRGRAVLAVLACALVGVAAGWPVPAGAAPTEPEQRITVAFRYEYVASWTPEQFERRLLSAFGERGVPLTVCVVPYRRDETHDGPYYPAPAAVLPLAQPKIELLVEFLGKGLVEVALLGYVHQERAPSRPYTELAGVPYSEQLAKISAGKDLLEQRLETELITFVPPFNTYDDNTVEAAETLGFRVLSAGALCAPRSTSALKFVPATCLVTDLRYAVECARESQDPAPLVVVMLHPHDFVDLDPAAGRLAFGELLELLDWLGEQEDLQLRTIAEVAEQERDLGLARYREYCNLRPDLPSRLLPSALEGLGSDVHYYPARETLANLNLWRLLRIGVFYGGIGLNGFLLTYLFLHRFAWLAGAAVIGTTLLAVGLGVYALRDAGIYCLGASALTFSGSAALAAWVFALVRPRYRAKRGNLSQCESS